MLVDVSIPTKRFKEKRLESQKFTIHRNIGALLSVLMLDRYCQANYQAIYNHVAEFVGIRHMWDLCVTVGTWRGDVRCEADAVSYNRVSLTHSHPKRSCLMMTNNIHRWQPATCNPCFFWTCPMPLRNAHCVQYASVMTHVGCCSIMIKSHGIYINITVPCMCVSKHNDKIIWNFFPLHWAFCVMKYYD